MEYGPYNSLVLQSGNFLRLASSLWADLSPHPLPVRSILGGTAVEGIPSAGLSTRTIMTSFDLAKLGGNDRSCTQSQVIGRLYSCAIDMSAQSIQNILVQCVT